LVSIIIPTYNRSHIICETLNSVLNQTYTNWECIIVDDVSTDDTVEIVKNYTNKDSRFSIFNRSKNKPKGANACRNYGFEKSTGELIIFFDDDDLLHKNSLKNRVNAVYQNNTADVVIFTTQEFKVNMGDLHQISNRDIEDPSRYNYLLSFLSGKFNWTIMSAIWKRASLKETVFDENLKRFQDVDFHLRQLLKKGIVVKRIFEVDNYYRTSNNPKAMNFDFRNKVGQSFIQIFKKIIPLIMSDEKLVKAFKRFIYVVFIRYIILNKNSEVYYFFKNEVIRHQIFTKKDKMYFIIQELITNNSLIKYKGIGIFKIEKKIKKHFNY
jgi:glycosyltransferase involved in cell wall biosynthesis